MIVVAVGVVETTGDDVIDDDVIIGSVVVESIDEVVVGGSGVVDGIGVVVTDSQITTSFILPFLHLTLLVYNLYQTNRKLNRKLNRKFNKSRM